MKKCPWDSVCFLLVVFRYWVLGTICRDRLLDRLIHGYVLESKKLLLEWLLNITKHERREWEWVTQGTVNCGETREQSLRSNKFFLTFPWLHHWDICFSSFHSKLCQDSPPPPTIPALLCLNTHLACSPPARVSTSLDYWSTYLNIC